MHLWYSENRAAKEVLERASEAGHGDRQLEANCIKALGDVHRMLSEYGAARARYEEALPIYREIGTRLGEANCIKALGDLLAEQGEVERALPLLDQAEVLFRTLGFPNRVAWVHNSRGSLWHHQGEYVAAVEAYTRAIETWPQEGAFYRNRARTLMEMDDFAAVAANLEKAAALAPAHPYLALRRAELAFYTQDYPSALRHAQEALARQEHFAPAGFLAALAHLALGDTEEAIRVLETALQWPYDKNDLQDTLRRLDRLPETAPPQAVRQFRGRLQEAMKR
ncbi:MAG: tetratricopeptide repeat protein [Chloroflexia bacterium]